MESQTDILVAGGGPTGMTAALEAASHGYTVTLVAPRGAMAGDERTTALMRPAIDLLSEMGLWTEIEEHAAPLRTMRIVDGTNRLVRAPTVTFDSHEIEQDAFGYNIPNRALNDALSKAVEKTGSIRLLDSKVSSATFGADHATVVLMDGQKIDARLVVAADGAKSLLRDAAGIGARNWSYPQSAIVLTFEHSKPHNFISTEFHTESGPFTQVPMAGNRSSLVWVVDPTNADRITLLKPEELAREVESRMDSMLGKVSNVTKAQAWPLSGMIAHRFSAGRVVLVGQAAHMFPPIGAQGLNLGLRDIADLGRALSSAGDDPGTFSVTSHYARLRSVDIASRTGAVDMLNRSLLTSFLPIQVARAAGLSVLGAIPSLRGFMMREGIEPGSGLRNLFRRPSLRGRGRAEAGRSS